MLIRVFPPHQTWNISRDPDRYISWYPVIDSCIFFIASVSCLYFSQLCSYAARFSYLLTITTLLYWPVISVMTLTSSLLPAIAVLNIFASLEAFPGLQTKVS